MIKHKIIEKQPMIIMGVPLRTTNENGTSEKEIPPHWDRFYKENLMERIPHRKSNDIYGLYTEYEKDHTKPYTLIVGCEVEEVDKVPDGFVVKIIPAAKYAHFSITGAFPQSLLETWAHVWQSDLKRSYKADLEHYGPEFFKNGSLDLYLSL